MLQKVLTAALGTAASLTTTAVVALHIILASSLSGRSDVKAGAIISTFLECCVLAILIFLFLAHVIRSCKAMLNRWNSIFFASSLFISIAATASSVATLVSLSNLATVDPSGKVARVRESDFLVGTGIALGLALACQLLFIVVFFVIERLPALGSSGFSIKTDEEANRNPPILSIPHNLKSIRYSRTLEATPAVPQNDETPVEARSPPASINGRSMTETMSIRSSISQVVRPITSRTKLLSQRSHQSRRSRTASMESRRENVTSSHSYACSQEEGFDSWDTSTVDAHNRQTVMESGSPTPGGRFLETIPASPTTSRSPSPGHPLDIPLPGPAARRSRSYSPASMRVRAPFMNDQPPRGDSPTSSNEAHIHPLFRSDSPTPPPMASPGTVVMAAPNAGVFLSDRSSIRSLNRMRSGSLPCQRSPLSRSGSLENIHALTISRDLSTEPPSPAELEEISDEGEGPERQLTPPIPEWVLSAGSRTSLSDYQTRKLQKDGVLPSPLSG